MNAAVETLVREAGVTETEARELLGIREDVPSQNPLEQLVREAGVSEREAKELLGIQEPQSKSDDPNIDFLRQSFPDISEASLRVQLQEARGDVEKATDLLLNRSVVQDVGPQNFDKRQRKKAQQLRRSRRREVKFDQKRQADIELIEQLTNLNASKSAELYDREGPEVLFEVLIPQKFVPPGQIHQPQQPQNTSRYRSLSLLEDIVGVNPSLRTILNAIEHHEVLLERAQERAMRYSHTQRAISADAWSSVRQERRLIRELQRLKTVQGDFACLRRSNLPNIVDLHGYTLDVALDVAQRVVDNLRKLPRSDSIELVTGAGRHSLNGVPVLKNGLRKLLEASRLRYHELEGSFIVYGGLPSTSA